MSEAKLASHAVSVTKIGQPESTGPQRPFGSLQEAVGIVPSDNGIAVERVVQVLGCHLGLRRPF